MPIIARWGSMDGRFPIDGPNCFMLVTNRPVLLLDPSGFVGINQLSLTFLHFRRTFHRRRQLMFSKIPRLTTMI